MYEIYLIDNTVNNKVYIGVTTIGLHDRWSCHKSCARNGISYPLYDDMRKFGEDKFSIHLIDSADTKELGEMLEIKYVEKFCSIYPNGYNLTEGGFHPKSSIWMTDHDRAIDRGNKIRKSLSGKPKSDEHRKHLSASRMGKFTGADNPFYGKHHNDVTKQRISDNNSKTPINMIDLHTDEILMQFKNPYDAARYVIDCGLTSSSEPKTCAARIVFVAKSENVNLTAYGFHWRLVKV